MYSECSISFTLPLRCHFIFLSYCIVLNVCVYECSISALEQQHQLSQCLFCSTLLVYIICAASLLLCHSLHCIHDFGWACWICAAIARDSYKFFFFFLNILNVCLDFRILYAQAQSQCNINHTNIFGWYGAKKHGIYMRIYRCVYVSVMDEWCQTIVCA